MSTTTEPTMKVTKSDIEARRKAAAMLGSIGGKAGTGDAKRRSPEVIQKAVKARIAANKARKAEKEAKEAKA